MKPALIVDIETSGTPFDGELLSLSWQEVGEEHAHVAPGDQIPDHVLDMMDDITRPFVSQTKYDARFLRLLNLPVHGPFYDTQVMAWVLNENQQLSLEAMAKRYVQIKMDKRLRIREGAVFFACDDESVVPITEAPKDQLWAYNARDVDATTKLFETLWQRLDDTEWLDYYLEEEVPFTETLLDMEIAGLPVDVPATEALRDELEEEAERRSTELLDDAGVPSSFNLNSGPMVAAFLFNKVFEIKDSVAFEPGTYNGVPKEEKVGRCQAVMPEGFTVESVGRSYAHGQWTLRGRALTPGRRTEKGERPSTSNPALLTNVSAVSDPWVQQYLAYRKVNTMLTLFLRKIPKIAVEDHGVERVYGRFNQTGTKTGRLSSSEPNMQNIPAHGELGEKIRGLFRGNLVVGDYSQLEPRLMAHFSGDPFLTEVYRNGLDIYRELASRIFNTRLEDVTDEERGLCKTLVLAMGYGAGGAKVGEILTINGYPTDTPQAKGYLAELTGIVPRFFEWREEVIHYVKRKGYVTTIGGRHRRLKAAFVDRRNWKNVGYGERQAVNAIVQGSAGDIVRRVMVASRELPYLRLLAQVHDELVWDYDPDIEWKGSFSLQWVRDLAEKGHGFKLNVPLVFEPMLCETWAQKGTGTGMGSLELPEDFQDGTSESEEDRTI